jgi:late competence protein required for DNA uptake (superfamily II DNA/RNA helicase)
MDKRSRPSTLLFVGVVNQAAQFADIYKHLGHNSATVTAQGARRREGMKAFKELSSSLKT